MSAKKKKPRRVHDIVFDDHAHVDHDDTEASLIQNFSYSDGGKSLEIDDHSSDSSDLEDIFSGIRKVPTYGELERRSASTVHKKKQPAKLADQPRPSSVTPAKTYRKPTETQRKDNGVASKVMPFSSSAGPSSRVTKPMSQITKHPHTQRKSPEDTPVIDISSDEEPSPERKRAKVYYQSTLLSHGLTTKGKKSVQKPPPNIENEISTDSFELADLDNGSKKIVASLTKVQPVMSDSSDSTIMGGKSPLDFGEDDDDTSGYEARRDGSWNFIKPTSEVNYKVYNFEDSQDSCSELDVNVAGEVEKESSSSDTDRSWSPLQLSQNVRGVRREGLDIVICETDNDVDEETQDPNAESDSDRTLEPEPSPVNIGHQLHRKTERRKSEETTPTPRQVPPREPIAYAPIDYSDDSSSDGEWLIKPSQTHTPRLLTRYPGKNTKPSHTPKLLTQNPSQITKPSQGKIPWQNNHTKQSTLISSSNPCGRKKPVLQKEPNTRAQSQASRSPWKQSGGDNDDNDDSEREGIFTYIRKLHQQSPKKPISGVLQKQVSESTSDEDFVLKGNLPTFNQGKKSLPSSSLPSSSLFNFQKSSSPNPSSVPLLAHRVDPFSFSEETDAEDDLPITKLLNNRSAKKRPASPVFGKSKKIKPDHVQNESVENGPLGTSNQSKGNRYPSSHSNQLMSVGDTKKSLSNLSHPEEQNHREMCTYSRQESTNDNLPFIKRKEMQKISAVDLTEDEETQDPNVPSDNEEMDVEQVPATTGLNEDSKEGLPPFLTKGIVDSAENDETQALDVPSDNEETNAEQVSATSGVDEDSKEGLPPFITKGPGGDKDLNEYEDSKEGLLPFITKGPVDDKDLVESEDSTEPLLPFIKKEPGAMQKISAVDLSEDEETQDPNVPSDNEEMDTEQVPATTGLNEDSKEGLLPFITKGPHNDKHLDEEEDSKEGLLPFITKGPVVDKDLVQSEDSTEGTLPFIKNEPAEDNPQSAKAGVRFSIKKEPAADDQQEAKADFSLAFTQADVYVIDSDDDGEDTSFAALSQSFVQFPIKEESEEEEDQDLSEVIFVDPWDADIMNTSAMSNEQSFVPVTIKQEKGEEDLSESLYLTQKAVQDAMNNWSDDETYLPDTDGELTKLAADVGEGWSDCDDDLLLSLNIEPTKPSSPVMVKVQEKPTPSVPASVKENQQVVKISTPTVTNSNLITYSPVKYRKIELSDEEGKTRNKPSVTIAPQQADLLPRGKISNAAAEKSPNNEVEMDLTPEVLTQMFMEPMEMDSQIVLSDEEYGNKTAILCAVDNAKDPSSVSKMEENKVVKEVPHSKAKSDTVSSVPSVQTVPASKPQASPFRFSVDPKVQKEFEKVEKSPEPFMDGGSQVEYADDLTNEQVEAYLSAKYTSLSPDRRVQSTHTKTHQEPIVVSDDDDKVDRQVPSLSAKINKPDIREVAIDLTEEVKISSKSKDNVEKEGLKDHVTKDKEVKLDQEATHKSRDRHPSAKEARDDTKVKSRSESKSSVESKERHDHKDTHKSSSKSSTTKEGDKKKSGRDEIKRKEPHSSSSSHTKDRKDEGKSKDSKSRSSSKVSEDIKKSSDKKHVGSSSSSRSDKDRTKERSSHSSTSKSSTHSSTHRKDDRKREDKKSSHTDISKDKKESTTSREKSSSSSRSSSHTSKTKDGKSSSSTSRSRSKSPKPHSKHESSSRPRESDKTKLQAKEKPSTSAVKNLTPSSKDESSSRPKESDKTKLHEKEKPSTSAVKNLTPSTKDESSSKPKEKGVTDLHSRVKPSTSTDDESDEGEWMSVVNRKTVLAQKTARLLGKAMDSIKKDQKVSPPEISAVPSAAVAKFQARMRGNHVSVQKPRKLTSSRSKMKTRIAAPGDDCCISMTQSIEIAKVNMYERAQRAREERYKNKEVKPVTNPSAHEKKAASSSSHDRSKSRSSKDNTSAGTKGKPEDTTAKAQAKSSKEDKSAKPSSSKHSSNSDKSKVSSTSSSSGKKDSTVANAIEDITESFRNLSQSQGQSQVETSKSSTVAVKHASSSTTVKTSNVATSSASAVPKRSETSSSSNTSAETVAAASTSSAVPSDVEPTVKKRRINLPVAAACSSTVPGTFRSVPQDPYELLKAMPALTIGDSGKSLTVDDFLNVVLQWIPKWMDEMDAQEGTAGPKPLPPFMTCAASGPSALLKSDTLWPVPDTFENAREYFEIMLGHILHEVWSATYSDWRRNKNRPTMASFIPVSKDANDSMFHTLIFQGLVMRNQQAPVSEGDLVIVHMKSIRRDGSPSGIQLVFGYVQRTEKIELRNPQQLHPKLGDFQWVRNTKRMVVSATIRFFYRIIPDNDIMDIQVVTSLISVLRQIGALIAFPRNPLSRDLLDPTRLKTFLPTEGREDKNLDKLYNSSQVRVINSVVASLLQPFVVPRVSLIQGPPGTGKSHTILAIIRNTIFRKTADGRIPCLMLCAPSNAAIDELVRRVSIENDVRKTQGNEIVRVVRIGSQASMSENSRQYSLDTKVKEAWENRKLLEKMKTMPMSIRKEMLAVHEQLPGLRKQLDAARKVKAAELVKKLEQDIDMLEKKEAKFKDTGKRNEPTSRDTSQLRYEVLAHAHIVACTLNSAGSRIITDACSFGQAQALNPSYKGPRFQFTGVLIDEACQCVEVEALIPLQYCATKLVLIGDPQQLPPTVISQDAETMKFSQSLFERLYNYFRMKSYSAVFLLDTQYRMHPEIAVFPSRHIYDGRLKTDPGLAEKRSLFPFRHYFVFDLVYSREQSDQRSLSVSNPSEVEFVLSLVKYLTSTKVKPHLLGIITPYKKQKLLIQDQLRNCNLQQVDVGTVDGFQGQEKDVIIFSCVRACSSNNKIGFVADKRRMNVALTRAKYGCYVVGHMTSLRVDADWAALVDDAVKRQVVVPVKSRSVREMLIHKVCVKPSHSKTTQKNKGAPNNKT